MKKLMIAAAAAAMIGGAQAAEYNVWYNGNQEAGYFDENRTWFDYNTVVTNGTALFEPYEVYSLTTNIVSGTVTNKITKKVNAVALDQLQIITTKTKPGKFFCLNTENNDIQTFYKPSAVSTALATDGAIYYDGEAWVLLTWNKNEQTASFWANGWCQYNWVNKDTYKTLITNYYATCKSPANIYKETAPWTFDCFEDKGGKKVWAVSRFEIRNTGLVDRKGQPVSGKVWGVNGTAEMYGQLDEKTDLVKDLKYADSANGTIKLTTYKDEKALEKAYEALVKKFEKAGGKLYDFAK